MLFLVSVNVCDSDDVCVKLRKPNASQRLSDCHIVPW